jgi:hypothetical protein
VLDLAFQQLVRAASSYPPLIHHQANPAMASTPATATTGREWCGIASMAPRLSFGNNEAFMQFARVPADRSGGETALVLFLNQRP